MRASSATFAQSIANPTHIYIVGFSDGVVKVGRTQGSRKRFNTLASQARARGASMTDVWLHETPDARGDEWALRNIGYRFFERVQGKTEYFRGDFTEFLSCIESRLEMWGRLPYDYVRVTPELPEREALPFSDQLDEHGEWVYVPRIETPLVPTKSSG